MEQIRVELLPEPEIIAVAFVGSDDQHVASRGGRTEP